MRYMVNIKTGSSWVLNVLLLNENSEVNIFGWIPAYCVMLCVLWSDNLMQLIKKEEKKPASPCDLGA